MKHLMSFNESSYPWVREEVRDLLSNLEDEGYAIRCSYMGGNAGYISISKLSKDESGTSLQFNLDDIKSEVVRAIDFLCDRYNCVVTAMIGTMSNRRDPHLQIDIVQ